MADRLRVIGFGKPPALALALRDGWFRREGVDVEFTRTPSSQRQIRGLLAGEWDVAHTAVDNVFEYVDQEDADLELVLVGEVGSDVRLIARDATDVASLRGKRLGVDSPRSGYALMAYLILAKHGIDRSGYEVVECGGSTERGKALAAGRVDFAMLGSPYDEEALAAGCHVVAESARYIPAYPALTVATRRTWAPAHRDVLTRYLRALLGAIRVAADAAKRDATIAALAAEVGTDVGVAARVYERAAKAREGAAPPTIDEMRASVTRALEMRRSVTGGTPGSIDRYLDLSYAEAAAL
ncbi:MAG: ABC transporter substrate-binding protein [Chloroflexota bacterium]|nr:ABC transporter substrate-binding protein [Chloroflexota bacterium]MDE3194198.1 ABC transporter substrate-binding protein [Chloroflexota bacterium]